MVAIDATGRRLMRGTAAEFLAQYKPEEIELAEPRCHHVSGRPADFRTCPFFATTAVTWPNRLCRVGRLRAEAAFRVRAGSEVPRGFVDPGWAGGGRRRGSRGCTGRPAHSLAVWRVPGSLRHGDEDCPSRTARGSTPSPRSCRWGNRSRLSNVVAQATRLPIRLGCSFSLEHRLLRFSGFPTACGLESAWGRWGRWGRKIRPTQVAHLWFAPPRDVRHPRTDCSSVCRRDHRRLRLQTLAKPARQLEMRSMILGRCHGRRRLPTLFVTGGFDNRCDTRLQGSFNVEPIAVGLEHDVQGIAFPQ